MKPYLRNLIINTGYMMKSMVTKDMVYSGESAFSHYSFINLPKVPVYAIHKSKIKDIELQAELIIEKEQVKSKYQIMNQLFFQRTYFMLMLYP